MGDSLQAFDWAAGGGGDGPLVPGPVTQPVSPAPASMQPLIAYLLAQQRDLMRQAITSNSNADAISTLTKKVEAALFKALLPM